MIKRTISTVHINIFRWQFLVIVRFWLQHSITNSRYTSVTFVIDRYTSWTWWDGWFAICWRDWLCFFWTWIVLTKTWQIYYEKCSKLAWCFVNMFLLLPLLKAFVRPRRRFIIPAAVFELLYCLVDGAGRKKLLEL